MAPLPADAIASGSAEKDGDGDSCGEDDGGVDNNSVGISMEDQVNHYVESRHGIPLSRHLPPRSIAAQL